MGPYEIVAPIGAGGMGEVYQARDTRLGREVAIKVSAEQFSERFEREARAIASLNHPDGRFVSYVSDESGKAEVYVRPFDPSVTTGSAAGGAKFQVSKDGGDGAHWRGDGKEILYMAPGGTVMSVEVTTTPVFQILGVPKPLFKSAAILQFWDLTPDGKRFLVPVPLGAISAALNWTAALQR